MKRQSWRAGLAVTGSVLVVVGISVTGVLIAGAGSRQHAITPGAQGPTLTTSPSVTGSPGPTATVSVPAAVWSPTAQQIADVTKVAATFAATNGDPTATTAIWAATTRSTYLSALGEGSANDGSAKDNVIVVVMAGHFVASLAHVPPGAALPHGDGLDFAWDPNTGRVTDWGIDQSPPSLVSLGETQVLPLPAPSASGTAQASAGQ